MKCKLGVGKCHIYFDNSLFLFGLFRQGMNTAEGEGAETRSSSAVSWSKKKKKTL